MKHRPYESWQEGTLELRAIGMKVQLPKSVRVKYGDYFTRIDDTKTPEVARFIDSDGNKMPKTLGSIISVISNESTKLDFLIDCYESEGLNALFVQGHEEGHIMDRTCNLAALWHEANGLGYNFDCFSSDVAVQNDNSMNMLYQSYAMDMNQFRFIDAVRTYFASRFNQKELIAHIGGLVSLVKSGQCKDGMIDELATAIQTGDEKHVRRKTKKIFGIQEINKDYFAKLDAERDEVS